MFLHIHFFLASASLLFIFTTLPPSHTAVQQLTKKSYRVALHWRLYPACCAFITKIISLVPPTTLNVPEIYLNTTG